MTAALQLPRLSPPAPRADGRASVLEAGNIGVGQLVAPLTSPRSVPGQPGGLARGVAPPLPVAAALAPVLPDGIRRGSTVAVRGSVSLLLALLGAASAEGSWAALVAMPRISVEAASEYGIDSTRLAFVPDPGEDWATAVGALIDAVDLVVLRPPATAPDGVIRRLAARARSKAAVLLPFLSDPGPGWPGADVLLSVEPLGWTGLAADEPGHGRLHGRQVRVAASGRGRNARPRQTRCWLPAPDGGIAMTTSA